MRRVAATRIGWLLAAAFPFAAHSDADYFTPGYFAGDYFTVGYFSAEAGGGGGEQDGCVWAEGTWADGTWADDTWDEACAPSAGDNEVPNVIGGSLAAADTALELVLLDTGIVTIRCSAEPADEVLAQNPAPGEFLDDGDLVNLTASNGMACVLRGRPGLRFPNFRMPGL